MKTNIFRILSSAVLIAAIPATASAGMFGTKLSTQNERAVMAGHMGAVSVSLAVKGVPCGVTNLTFQNLQTGRKHKVANYIYKADPRGSLNLVAVPPGQYGIARATCNLGNQTYVFKDIARGYGPLTVQAGEVVYPGTFSINHRGRSVQGYDLQDHTPWKARAMMQKYPRLAPRFIPRPVYTPLATGTQRRQAYAGNRW